MRTVEWVDGAVRLIDQTRLPEEEVYVDLHTVDEVAEAISSLKVRGAPAIGAAAAMGLALAAVASDDLEAAASRLAATRPTAVNLRWALDRVLCAARSADNPRAAAVHEALVIAEEAVAVNRRLGAA